MIHSPCKGLDDSLHLQCEEEGSEARNVSVKKREIENMFKETYDDLHNI